MDTSKLIDLLFQHNKEERTDFDQAYLKVYLIDLLLLFFENYYDKMPLGYWNEDKTEWKEPIDLTDDYMSFMVRNKFSMIQLDGPYGMSFFDWPTMLYRTLNWMGVHKGEVPEAQY